MDSDWGAVPDEVMEAARKVEQWARRENQEFWRMGGLADRKLADRLEGQVERLTAKLARNHPSRPEGETHAQSILANRRWREAVYDACTVAHIGWDAGDPRKTIDQLIDWHVQVALDPAVSKPVADLHAQVKHWKANHDHLAKRTALLLQRPDLPVDRIPAYRELEALQTKYDMMKTAYETELASLRQAAGAFHVLTAMQSGAVRVNVIEDDTVPPNTMIVEGEGHTLTLDGITKEFIAGVGKDKPTPLEAAKHALREPVDDPLTDRKAREIMAVQGHVKVGYVLLHPETGAFGIVSQCAVRWLAKDHMWRLMHEQDGKLFGTGTPAKPYGYAREVNGQYAGFSKESIGDDLIPGWTQFPLYVGSGGNHE